MSLDLTVGAAPLPVAVPTTEGAGGRPDPTRVATVHAVGRDLERLGVVLAGPITAVRRSALVAHVGFLVEQTRQVHLEPANRQSLVLSRLRHECRLWSRDPRRRTTVLGAAEALAAALTGPVARSSGAEAVSSGSSGWDAPPPGRPVIGLSELPARRPTALAYRYFWLLDGLPPQLAGGVADGFTGPARWVLRNVLSGEYNRRAYLMWVGGGSGPAL